MRPNIIYSNGEIDFSSLRSIIFSKRGRNISLITVLSALLLTYIFLLTSTKEFLVTAKIAPVESVAMGSSASNAAGTMSSFGSMLGIDLGGTGSSSNYEKFKEIFASERMAQIFIELRDPRPHIFGDGFNPETIDKAESHHGMQNIEYRVNSLNGNFTVDSNKKSGTMLLITVPV